MANIRYIQFNTPVQLGGGLAASTHWSADKHAKATEVAESGAWIHIFPVERLTTMLLDDGVSVAKVETKRTGRRIRVPMTNVAYIDDDGGDDKAKK